VTAGESVPDAESESQTRMVDRLTFFSDAVVAIAITLLAIDLPVPSGDNLGEFWTSVRHNSGHYAAFLISFYAISAAWSHHHEIFRYARRMDQRLRSLNTFWLLMIVLNPFATRLLTSPGGQSQSVHAVKFGFYALTQALVSLAMVAMLRHMVKRHQVSGLPGRFATETAWDSYGLLAGFALSIPVFFVIGYAWVFWIVVPWLVGRLYRLRYGRDDDPREPPNARHRTPFG
jgi:uncharacterized membrane protein